MSTPTVPKFDSKSAAGVTPYHNEKTLQRTVAFHQEAGKSVHAFSATGLFIATLGTDEAAAFAAQAKKTDTDSRAAAKKANDEAHEAIVNPKPDTPPVDAVPIINPAKG